MNIQSILRHWFTLAATAVTLWLISTLLLSADDAKALTDAVSKLVEPLVIIAALALAALYRMALAWIAQIFRHGSGETGNTSQGSGWSLGILLVMGTAAVLGGLPSCSPALVNSANAVPIRIGITTDYGNAAYSSKRGIEVDAVIRAEK